MNLKSKPYTNVEPAGSQSIAEFYDMSKDDAMSNVVRGSLYSWVDTGTGKSVQGAHYWKAKNVIISVSNGVIDSLSQAGTKTTVNSTLLQPTGTVTFADYGDALYMANGGKIVKYDGETCAYLTSESAPSTVSHVAVLNGYLLALIPGTQTIAHSDVRLPDTWLGEFVTARIKEDDAVGVYTAWEEILVPGESTIESFYETGVSDSPFAKIGGSLVERGCIAPQSVALCDNRFFFLDTERNVIALEGRSPRVISNPFDDEFKKLDTAADAVAIYLPKDTKYVLTFPAENKTFAYDYKRDVWARWSTWDIDRQKWLGNCSCYAWNKQIVGGTDGVLYEYRTDAETVGENIVSELWTGWINHGGTGEKYPSELSITVKRGVGAPSSTEPFLLVYWRNNGKTVWSTPRKINLGQYGETEVVKRLHRIGSYRTRQYRFTLHDAPGGAIIDGVES